MKATVSLRDLTAWIAEQEGQLAPTGETDLWGDYMEAMRKLTGVFPTYLLGDPSADHSVRVEVADAAWWIGAYMARTRDGLDGSDALELMGARCLEGEASDGSDWSLARLKEARDTADDDDRELPGADFIEWMAGHVPESFAILRARFFEEVGG